LYDAIGKSIIQTGEHLANMKDEDRPEKVLFVIFTDGEENHSSEYNYIRVKELIKEQTDKYNWQFIYLGANQDGMVTGASLGISAAKTVTYDVYATGSTFAKLYCRRTRSGFEQIRKNIL